MSKLERVLCPECGGAITIWFDMNIQIEYLVKKDGSLSKVVVVSEDNDDARFGVKCKSCGWSVHGHDDEIDLYETLIQSAAKKADDIELTAKVQSKKSGGKV